MRCQSWYVIGKYLFWEPQSGKGVLDKKKVKTHCDEKPKCCPRIRKRHHPIGVVDVLNDLFPDQTYLTFNKKNGLSGELRNAQGEVGKLHRPALTGGHKTGSYR